MENKIPKDINGITNIQPHELSMELLDSKKLKLITDFVNKKNQSVKHFATFAFIAGTMFPAIILFIAKNTKLTTDNIITLVGFAGIFYLVGYLILQNRFKPATQITGLMIGTLNDIWWMSSTQNNKRHYYLDVIFSATQTRLKHVKCNESLAKTLKPHDQILVFTWNGNVAYGIKYN